MITDAKTDIERGAIVMADKTKRKALKALDNEYDNTKKAEKLKRQQQNEKNKLEDQQAHGSLGDTVEDLGIQLGQDLGLSLKTTTGFVMGVQDAAVNLFSSNKDIVEYYKNYDANREKMQQQVNSVYSREFTQNRANEELKEKEKESKENYKEKKEKIKNGDNNGIISAEQAADRYQKACMIDLPEVLSGVINDGYSID